MSVINPLGHILITLVSLIAGASIVAHLVLCELAFYDILKTVSGQRLEAGSAVWDVNDRRSPVS